MALDELRMYPDVLAAILEERKLAYLMTDGQLRVRCIYDPAHLIVAGDDQVIGQALVDLAPELIGNEDALRAISAGQQSPIRLEMVNRLDSAGETRYHRLLVKPRQPGEGHPQGVVYLVEDVTEIGEMQQRLMQRRNELLLLRNALDSKNRELTAANLELRKVADMKSTFVSIAAHELRTPLAIMRGYVDMLLDEAFGDLAAGQREALTILSQSVGRLLDIVNNLLDLARLEAGRIELVMHPIDLDALVRATAKEYRPMFVAAQQSLVITAAPDLPAALCDETRVSQILGNLLSNASKYTAVGGQVELAVGVLDAPGELVVSVRDNGVGIPLDEQDRLGNLFFRASTADLISTYGAGMGLNITRSLVQLHGGRFWFESVEGQGSTFYVTFLMANQPDD
jgi:signal transduction histidine kinase